MERLSNLQEGDTLFDRLALSCFGSMYPICLRKAMTNSKAVVGEAGEMTTTEPCYEGGIMPAAYEGLVGRCRALAQVFHGVSAARGVQ